MSDEEDVDGQPLTGADLLRSCAVWSGGDSAVDAEYPMGVCEVIASSGEQLRIAIIVVGEVSGKFLVAVPHKAWHRTVARRLLPSSFMTKSVACDVPFATARNPVAETVNSKLWLGLLAADYVGSISFEAASEAEVSVVFDDDDELFLPLATELIACAEKHFVLRPSTSSFESVPHEVEAGMEHRVASLESNLSGIREQLEVVLNRLSTISVAAPATAPRSPPATRPKAASKATISGLDPAVAQAALTAGIPAQHLEEMARLVNAGKPKLPDLPRGTPARKDPLSESEEEALAQELEEKPGEDSGVDPMVAAITKLTAISQHLAGQKKKESSLEFLLDGAGFQGSSDSSSLPSSRKNAAALRALRKTLISDPEQLYKVIERNMEEDFSMVRMIPGSPLVPVSARGWLETRSKVQNFKTPVTFLWGVAGILDALRDNRISEARARACLLLCQGDQLSIDKGNWIVASAMSLEDPPPFAAFATHSLPTDSELPATKLIDARWMDLFLHHLNEIDQLSEKKKKLAFRKTPDAPAPDPKGLSPKRAAKGKATGKGSGSGDTGKDGQKDKEAA